MPAWYLIKIAISYSQAITSYMVQNRYYHVFEVSSFTPGKLLYIALIILRNTDCLSSLNSYLLRKTRKLFRLRPTFKNFKQTVFCIS